MPKPVPGPSRAKSRARACTAPAVLERRRDLLLGRLRRVNEGAKQTPGYQSAARLLNPIFRRSDLATRLAVLQAANFMIEILERIPPPS